MKNEDQIIELLIEHLQRRDKMEAQAAEDRKLAEKRMISFEQRMDDFSKRMDEFSQFMHESSARMREDKKEFNQQFYINQKAILANQEEIRTHNLVLMALLETQGSHSERLDRLEGK